MMAIVTQCIMNRDREVVLEIEKEIEVSDKDINKVFKNAKKNGWSIRKSTE